MRSALLVAFGIGLVSSSYASFEMMLMYDHTNRQFVRYDPINNAYLGSFGQGSIGPYGNPIAISLDPTRPGTIAFAEASGTIRHLNYSTGEEVGTIKVAGVGVGDYSHLKVLSNGNYLFSAGGGGSILVDKTSGATLQTISAGSSGILDADQMGDGSFITLERLYTSGTYSYTISKRNSAGTSVGSLALGSLISAPGYYTHLTLTGTTAYLMGSDGTYQNFLPLTINATSFTTNSYTGFGFSAGTGYTNLSLGHYPSSYFVQNAATGDRLWKYDIAAATYSPVRTMSFTQDFRQIATVVAPEPASFAALGIGVLALLRRRRR